jgi:hypothetical protein
MNFKYTTAIVLILMIFAVARGFSPLYQHMLSFAPLHAYADGDGGGGAGGDGGDGGGGAGGGGTGGGGGGGTVDVPGCTDPTATNYNPSATVNDGSCTYTVVGCMDPTATNYNPAATSQAGVTCTYTPIIYGCMDPTATNYNPSATSQTGITCTYPVVVYGCMDPTATNYNPNATSQTGITCLYPTPAPTCTLLATPSTIQSGSSSSLSWTTSNATSFSINQGIGGVTPVASGSTSVTPVSNITYTGTATGAGGSTTCTATITVTALPPAPTCTLSASPTNIQTGNSSVLSWTTTGATSISIDRGVGGVTPVSSGSHSVTPSSSTTYTATATGSGGTVTCAASVIVTSPPPAPTCTLSASPSSIQVGNSSTLSWITTNGSTFSINQGIGGVTPVASGSKSVTPAVTTTYTGTVTSSQGSATCSATITVTSTPPPPPAPTCTLVATPASVTVGTPSTLSWVTSNATSFSINQGIGSVTPVASGSRSVTAAATTTYTGTATGAGGTVTCTATITVTPLPPAAPTCTLSVSPSAIQTGSSATLSWTTTNVTSLSINQGIGSVSPVAFGSRSVSPIATTTYTGTATGAGGTTTCTATIAVSPTPPPTSCTLTASPSTVNTGDHTTLTWTTTNPNTFSIDNGIGQVTPALGGSISSLAINGNTTFTGIVVSPTGQSATCTANVTVNNGGGGSGPSCSMSVTPSSIQTGSSATLSWNGSGISNVDIDNGIATATTSPGSTLVGPTGVQTYTYTGTFHATNGQSLTCSATLTVTGGGGGSGGCTSNCGGGGGGGSTPTITLASLPHVNSQPLTYLYLSQIPYTGLDLGPVGTLVYWLVLVAAALMLAYFVLFGAVPFVNSSIQDFGTRVAELLNAERLAPAPAIMAPVPTRVAPVRAPSPRVQMAEAPRGYSTYDGFKSFANRGPLSIEDIVKGLTREHSVVASTLPSAHADEEEAHAYTEPIYENVEPIAPAPVRLNESIPSPLQIAPEPVEAPAAVAVSADVKGFAVALLEGDRAGVFSGLRQHMRGGGRAEQFLSNVTCLIDDVYRARVDGSPCDADLARISARLSTPTLEKLVTSLTTAIDSSYSVDVTGAKLALTRALTTLGA